MPEITGTSRSAAPRSGWIGVVTVTYNSAGVLPEFFESLAAQSCSEYTLYVVDNASKDASLELCRNRAGLPIVLMANDTNVGVAEGNNQGIRAALDDGCEYVLLLNNDTTFESNLFAELRDGLIRHQCSMTVPKILYYDDPGMIWAAGGRFRPSRSYAAQHYGDGERDGPRFNRPRSISYSSTCCVLIRRHVFERIGLMDPAYFVYSDDVDFMYRAMKAGIRMMYLPSCRVLHKVSSLTGGIASSFAIRFGTRNRVYFLRKHQSRLWASARVAQYRLYILLRYVTGRDTKAIWDLRRNALAEGQSMEIRGHGERQKPQSRGVPDIQR